VLKQRSFATLKGLPTSACETPSAFERVRELIPKVACVVINTVFLQKGSEFILKGDAPMVLFLALNVSINAIKL
jgi:hypothetical protein